MTADILTVHDSETTRVIINLINGCMACWHANWNKAIIRDSTCVYCYGEKAKYEKMKNIIKSDILQHYKWS